MFPIMVAMVVMALMAMVADANFNPDLEGKMNKNFFKPGLIAIAALLSLSFMTGDFALARDGKGDDRPMIQLTQEQREKADAILNQNREASLETRQALKEKRGQLKELMQSSNPDRAKAEALCAEIGALESKMLLNRFDLSQQLVKEGLPPQLANRKAFDGKGDRHGERKGDRKDKRKGDKRD